MSEHQNVKPSWILLHW